ncbi:MAG TPA: amidohydrolase family protein [Terriglobales bacterium]|nr:amidohydrolase family protein [Terriglobales bacterium]
MKRFSAALVFSFVVAFLSPVIAAPQSKPSPYSSRAWVTDVVIVSPENLDHLDRGSVLIENGRIAKVERNLKAKAPRGATVIRGNGQYLIPGLIDSHVHLASIPGMTFDQDEQHRKMAAEYYAQLPRSYLYYGYTTLIDLAVYERKVLDDFRQAPLHPDLYDCGESLPFANGYPMSFAPAPARFKVFPNFIYDTAHADRIPSEYKAEDHTPEADVARDKREGAICVKTYFERGFADDKNLPVMSAEIAARIRQAATRDRLVLMMHANSFEAQKFAVDANVDVIAHGMWNWGQFDRQKELPEEIKQLLDRIVEKRIGYQPTIQVINGEGAYFDPEYLKMPEVAKVVPKSLLDWFGTPQGKWFGNELNDEKKPDADMIAMFEHGPLRRVRQATAYLASKDANFVFGTDTPSAPTYGNLPGLNGYLEMKQLQEAGVSLTQIFKAATINNAREFKMDSQIGTIEPGKIANLVLMKQSPLSSIAAYDSVTAVFVHGREISRESLAADSQTK